MTPTYALGVMFVYQTAFIISMSITIDFMISVTLLYLHMPQAVQQHQILTIML